MILYNITTQVSWAVHDEWKRWLVEEYLPAFVQTKAFTHYQLVKLLEVNEEDGVTYAIQLYGDSLEKFEEFRQTYLSYLQKAEKNQWGENTFSFASLMQVIN